MSKKEFKRVWRRLVLIKVILRLVPNSWHWRLRLYVFCDPLADRINKLREGRVKFDSQATMMKTISKFPMYKASVLMEYYNYLVDTYNELVKQYNLIMC